MTITLLVCSLKSRDSNARSNRDADGGARERDSIHIQHIQEEIAAL